MKIVIPDDYQGVVPSLRCFATLAGHEVVTTRGPTADPDVLARDLAEAEIVVLIRERVPMPRALIERLPKLKLISQVGRSTNHVDLAACRERGITVTAGAHGSEAAPAELTFALILAAMKRVPQEAARMKAGQLPGPLGQRLAGRTLGILGYGKIAELVARMGRGFGMQLLAWGREGSIARARADGIEVAASRAALFERSDVLSVHLRLNAETRGGITRADLDRMKPTALFVNTARATLVEKGALVAALRAGRPGFAAVDVYDREPVPDADAPLVAMDNVVCTPHIGWAIEETFEQYFGEAFDNVAAWVAGRPVNVVTT